MVVDRQLRASDPGWLVAAFGEVGQMEKDPDHNPRIVQYHAHTSLGATTDETPWCSSFVCFIMDSQGVTSTASAASLSWLRWGRVLDKPMRGCIVILERVDGNGQAIPHRGHVGFWLGEDEQSVWLLGGNQSDKVGVNAYPRSRILGYRWPATPVNSTTNMASVSAAVGTVATAAPVVTQVLESVETSTDTVLGLSGRISGLFDKIISTPVNLVSVVGLLITVAALWYIIKERNAKIKRLGV